MSGRGKGSKATKGKAKSRSSRAGLTFPVDMIHRLLRKGKLAENVGAGAPVYLAAVMEDLVRNLLGQAGGGRRIEPADLQDVVREDPDWKCLALEPQKEIPSPGLTFFPVGRIHRLLRTGNYAESVDAEASVYLAAVLEYLVARVLKSSGNLVKWREEEKEKEKEKKKEKEKEKEKEKNEFGWWFKRLLWKEAATIKTDVDSKTDSSNAKSLITPAILCDEFRFDWDLEELLRQPYIFD